MARLLTVEDSVPLLLNLVETLETAGYAVDSATSAKQAQRCLLPLQGTQPAYAAILSDFNLGDTRIESGQTGMNVFQYAWRVLHPMPPFIGSSSEMTYWEPFRQTRSLHLIPKVLGGWDAEATLAKLTELGITP